MRLSQVKFAAFFVLLLVFFASGSEITPKKQFDEDEATNYINHPYTGPNSTVRVENSVEILKLFSKLPKSGGCSTRRNKLLYMSNNDGKYRPYELEFNFMEDGKLQKSHPTPVFDSKFKASHPKYLNDGTIIFHQDANGTENYDIGFHNKFFYPNSEKFLSEYLGVPKNEFRFILQRHTKNYLYILSNFPSKQFFSTYRIPKHKCFIEFLQNESQISKISQNFDENLQRLIEEGKIQVVFSKKQCNCRPLSLACVNYDLNFHQNRNKRQKNQKNDPNLIENMCISTLSYSNTRNDIVIIFSLPNKNKNSKIDTKIVVNITPNGSKVNTDHWKPVGWSKTGKEIVVLKNHQHLGYINFEKLINWKEVAKQEQERQNILEKLRNSNQDSTNEQFYNEIIIDNIQTEFIEFPVSEKFFQWPSSVASFLPEWKSMVIHSNKRGVSEIFLLKARNQSKMQNNSNKKRRFSLRNMFNQLKTEKSWEKVKIELPLKKGVILKSRPSHFGPTLTFRRQKNPRNNQNQTKNIENNKKRRKRSQDQQKNVNFLLSLTISNTTEPPSVFLSQISIQNLLISQRISPKYHKIIPSFKKSSKSPKEISKLLAKEQFFSFKSSDGLTIHYSIMIPPSRGQNDKLPVLFHLHGGPESQYRPVFRSQYQFLAGKFLIVSPNVRGSTGFGKTFTDADSKEKRIFAVRDVYECALDVASRFSDVVDRKNFFLIGSSYGGYLSVATPIFFPRLFVGDVPEQEMHVPDAYRTLQLFRGFNTTSGIAWKGSVSHVGVLDFLTFFNKTAPARRNLRKEKYGDFENESERSQILEFLSPVSHLVRLEAPVFLVQGKNDPRVPVSVAENFFKKISSDSSTNEIVNEKSKILILEDEGHGFSNSENKVNVFAKIYEWLMERLKDEK